MSEFPFRRVWFSSGVRADLITRVEEALDARLGSFPDLGSETSRSLVVLRASEIILKGGRGLPPWMDVDSSFLVVADVPEPALFRIPSVLRVHKPDQRIHVTRDEGAVKRQAIALVRDHPLEGVVDAYELGNDLVVVLGDMTVRSFPVEEFEALSELDAEVRSAFEIHPSGSYLRWPSVDLIVGASQLLQALDPMYLAEVEIERYAREKMSLALRLIREDEGLTQSDIPGVSDRHVRRLENEDLKLTAEVASKYAAAFDLPVHRFLRRLGGYLSDLKDPAKQQDSLAHHGSTAPDHVRHLA